MRISDLDREMNRLDGSTDAGGDVAGGTAVLFPEIEPWPDAVDGAALLDALADLFTRHLMLPEGGADAAALWCLHAHAHDMATISPILAITSPAPECGKTTLLTLLVAVTPKPLTMASITTAALFRAVEKWRPTLLIDEGDTFLRKSDELRGVINSGHNRSAAYVIRSVGEDHEPRRFKTWAPKVIALIGKLPPTLSSRAIHIEMRRLAPGEIVAPVRADRLDHLEPLARKAVRWVADHDAELRDAEPDMPAILRSRRADNWRPLFAIADVAGGDWPQRARRAAETLSAGHSDETIGVMLLEDVCALFGGRGAERIASSEIVEYLVGLEHRPWSELGRGAKPLTVRKLATLLEPFGVRPTKFRIAGHTPGTRGYELAAFDKVFTYYLGNPGDQSATTPQTADSLGFGDSRSATKSSAVADRNPPEVADSLGCGVVADGKREPSTENVIDPDPCLDDEVAEWTG